MSDALNVLLITSDQHHASCMGADNPKIRTPALDRLAREGTIYDRAYCPNPTCTPTRASIITGQYPSCHGAWSLGTKLDENRTMLGDLFQADGYDATLVGKAHFQPLATAPDQTSIECQPIMRQLDFWRNFHGPWYGFNHIETARMHADESHAGQHYGIWLEENGLANWLDYFDPWPTPADKLVREYKWNLPERYHYSAWTAERTIANIERATAAGQPFLMWSSFHDPHPPYLVPEPWDTMYNPADMEPGELAPGELERMTPLARETQVRGSKIWDAYRETPFANHGFGRQVCTRERLCRDMAVYYGMVSLMDHHIGRILDSLDRLGIAENTLVVFSTDHGHYLGQHGLTAKGAFHYEDGIRIPFLVRCPGRVPANGRSTALQSLVDLAPTFLAAAGLDVPVWMQGVNQWPVWMGKQARARENCFCEHHHQPTALNLRTYIDDRYKLSVFRGKDFGELYDLQEDPREVRNLWDDPSAAGLKAEVMRRFVYAELDRSYRRYPRIAHA